MSSKAKINKTEDLLSSGLLLLMKLLAVAAFILGCYLAWTSLSGSAVAGCGPDSGCDRVLHSRWGYWFGIPVSIPALALYVVVFAFLQQLGPGRPVETQRRTWRMLFVFGLVILGAATWFLAVQSLIIKSFCPWCMVTHITGSVLALLILSKVPIRKAPEKARQAEQFVFIPPALAKRLGAFAALGLAVLIGGQFLHQKKLYQVQSIAGNMTSAGSNAPAYAMTVPSSPEPPAQRNLLSQTNPQPVSTTNPTVAAANSRPTRPNPLADVPRPTPRPGSKAFQIYQGRFAFDLNEVPLIGSPTAPQAMVSLFDYTCHHCRITHPIIMQAHQAFGDQLAIVSLPMPLDGKCNFTVNKTPKAHTNACDYARLGLAVWHANRGVHPQYDEFIFAPAEPPPLESARQYAAQLVGGPDVLNKALSDGWVNQYLKLGIDIYATNYIHVGNGSMPQIIIGTRLATGTIAADELRNTITQQLRIQPRP
jgi:uncharacterized membrane protein